jgi:hypothetical protein
MERESFYKRRRGRAKGEQFFQQVQETLIENEKSAYILHKDFRGQQMSLRFVTLCSLIFFVTALQ